MGDESTHLTPDDEAAAEPTPVDDTLAAPDEDSLAADGDADQPPAAVPRPARTPPRSRRPDAATRRRRRLIAGAALAIVVVLAIAATCRAGSQSSKTQYTTAEVTRGVLAVTVDGSGDVASTKTSGVSPTVSGRVVALRVREGSHVDKGQWVLTLANDDLTDAKGKAWASYRQAQESVENAELKVLQAEQQQEELEKRSDSPTHAPTALELEVAEEQVDAACAGLTAARANRRVAARAYEQAKEDYDARFVKAPARGTVTAVNVAVGDNVSAGTGGSSSTSGQTTAGSSAPIVISDLGRLYATISLAEADLVGLRRNQKATLTFDAVQDLTITGKVAHIDPTGTNDQGVVTFDVDISFDVQDAKLRPGMSAAATVITRMAQNALLVPNSAVKTTDGQSYVQVVQKEGAEPTDVTVRTGLSNDTYTQIVSGVKEGDTVVTGTLSSSSTSSGQSGAGGFRMLGGGGPPGR
jgi:RND family efflux transporter MFP subunit